MLHAKKLYLASALAMTLAFTACSSDSTDKAENTGTTTPAASQMADSHDSSALHEAATDDALTGTIVDTFASGGYTYIQLDNGQEKIWAAISETPVEKGQEISLANGPVMRDFHSTTLDRTFPEIVFSSGIKGATSAHGSTESSVEGNFMANLKAGESAPALDTAAATGGSTKAIVSAKDIKVAKAEGETGHTVEEIFSQADKLNGQKVKVRGKVVKVSPMIMGVNWLHLQDGTGNPMQNTHDLVVTSDEVAALDSIVLIEGTVAAKKDFGMGYYYDALVEKAVIAK